MYCSSLLTILSAKNYTKNKFKEPDLQNRVQVQTEINITETPPAPANYANLFRLKISVRRHKTYQIRENEVVCVTPENRFERYKFPSSSFSPLLHALLQASTCPSTSTSTNLLEHHTNGSSSEIMCDNWRRSSRNVSRSDTCENTQTSHHHRRRTTKQQV